MIRSPSTTRRAGSVMLEPTSPGSLSTVTTSSSATFSCLPPQRTIAYTRELSLSSRLCLALMSGAYIWRLYLALRPLSFLACHGTPVSRRRARLNVHTGPAQRATPDRQGYQTLAPTRTRLVRPLDYCFDDPCPSWLCGPGEPGCGLRRRRPGLVVWLGLRLPRLLMPLGRLVRRRLLRHLRACGDDGDRCRSARAQPGRLAPGHCPGR